MRVREGLRIAGMMISLFTVGTILGGMPTAKAARPLCEDETCVQGQCTATPGSNTNCYPTGGDCRTVQCL